MSKNNKSDEWISGEIGLTINGKTVLLNVSVPSSVVHPRRMLPVFQKLTNTFVEMGVRDDVETGRAVSCKAGCGACCRQIVPLAAIEAHAISALVKSMPKAKQTLILQRFKDAIEKLAAADLLEILREREKFPETTPREIGLRYFALDIACPFLENESCSIHKNRPLACREYLVTSPAENCANPTAETVRQIPIPAKVSNAVIKLSQNKRDAGFVPFVPLTLALEFSARTVDDSVSDTGQNILKKVFDDLTA
ncbi:MAG: YkgJ family cysteine cluster protein [Pyrinomonadaceae bacterium]|nr:YkgJ family cysteine cluster protein [Pyrinomonadaceae bacterium]